MTAPSTVVSDTEAREIARYTISKTLNGATVLFDGLFSYDDLQAFLEGFFNSVLEWPRNPEASHAAADWLRELPEDGGSHELPYGITVTVTHVGSVRAEPSTGSGER